MNTQNCARNRQFTLNNTLKTLQYYGLAITVVLAFLSGRVALYNAITNLLGLMQWYVNGALFIDAYIVGIAVSNYRNAEEYIAEEKECKQIGKIEYRYFGWLIDTGNVFFSESEKSGETLAGY